MEIDPFMIIGSVDIIKLVYFPSFKHPSITNNTGGFNEHLFTPSATNGMPPPGCCFLPPLVLIPDLQHEKNASTTPRSTQINEK